MIAGNDYPLGLRREALRTFARPRNGGGRSGPRAGQGREAPRRPQDRGDHDRSTTHPDRASATRPRASCRCPRRRRGRPLPPISELIGRDGRADQRPGRLLPRRHAIACGSCHRVQGQGQWVGPDLSTIGTKYGKDELLRSILNPSAAIGYNFRSSVLALDDGRVLTGLPVEDTPDRLVLKTADGQRSRPARRRRGPQDQRRLADARRPGRGDDRPGAGRPARLPVDPQAAGEHRRPVPGDRPGRRPRATPR